MPKIPLDVVISAKDEASKKVKGLKKELSGLQKIAIATVGAIAGFAIFRKASQFMGEATEAAKIQETMEARLAASLRQSVGATKEQIKELINYAAALQTTTMYADEQIISAMGILSTFQLTTDQIKESTDRLLDMAAGTEKATGEQQDLVAISMALGRALTMGVGALTRYGVVLSEAEKEAIRTANGNEKLMLILQALDNNYKGIAEAMATTYAGQIKQAENAWGDLKEMIGKAVLPILSDLTTGLVGTAGALGETSTEGLILFDTFRSVYEGAALVTKSLTQIGIGAKSAWTTLKKWNEQLKVLFPWMKKNDEAIEEYNQQLDQNAKQIDILDGEYEALIERMEVARGRLKLGTSSWEEFFDTIKAGTPAIAEVAGMSAAEAKKIADAYRKMVNDTITQLQRLEDRFRGSADEEISALQEAITARKEKMTQLEAEYRAQTKFNKPNEYALKLAEEYVKEQDEVYKAEERIRQVRMAIPVTPTEELMRVARARKEMYAAEAVGLGLVPHIAPAVPYFPAPIATAEQAIRNFNFNFEGAFIGDPEQFKEEVVRMLNRESELKAIAGE